MAVFRNAVAEIEPGRRVIIDMAGVRFLDSCGVGALIAAVRRVREIDGTVSIAAVCPSVRRVLNLTGFDRIVELFETVQDAIRFLDGGETESPAHGDPIAI